MKRFLAISGLVLLALAVAIPAHAAAKVTVGDFLLQIAHAQNLPASDLDVALISFKATGVKLPVLDFKAPLTEGTVSKVFGSFGLTVTTKNPEKLFGQDKVTSLLSSYGGQLADRVPRMGSEVNSGWSWWERFWRWFWWWWNNRSRNCP